MRFALMFAMAEMAGCSSSSPSIAVNFRVSPDQRHIAILDVNTVTFVDIESGIEVGRADGIDTIFGTFSGDGSVFLTRSRRGTAVTLPVAGGAPIDLGATIDVGTLSPDGSRVAFLRNEAPCSLGVSGRYCGELFTASSRGGPSVRVASELRLLAATIFPTDKDDVYAFAGNDRVAFNDAGGSLRSVAADGSGASIEVSPSTGLSSGGVPLSPLWTLTPDGSRILFADADGLESTSAAGGTKTLIVPGGTETNVPCFAEEGGFITRCGFSPDGTRVAVVMSFSGTLLTVLPVAGGKGQSLAVSSAWVDFAADNRLLFFDASGLMSTLSPSGAMRQLSVGSIEMPVPSPDGNWLAMNELRPRDGCPSCMSLRIVSTVTGDSLDVNDMAGAFAFSSDSSRLLVVTGDLFVIPVTGGTPQRLERDVYRAAWAGPLHIVVSRLSSHDGLAAGVHITSVPQQ